MIIAIPVENDEGIESRVCAHFGSAPAFLIVDTETSACRAVPNRNQHHAHGACMPLASLQGERLDGIVVGGIGAGALARLNAVGLSVFLASAPTVSETVAAMKSGRLERVDPGAACGHHGQNHGCGHDRRG